MPYGYSAFTEASFAELGSTGLPQDADLLVEYFNKAVEKGEFAEGAEKDFFHAMMGGILRSVELCGQRAKDGTFPNVAVGFKEFEKKVRGNQSAHNLTASYMVDFTRTIDTLIAF